MADRQFLVLVITKMIIKMDDKSGSGSSQTIEVKLSAQVFGVILIDILTTLNRRSKNFGWATVEYDEEFQRLTQQRMGRLLKLNDLQKLLGEES